MNLMGMIGGAIGNVVEEVLIAFRADTSDVERKMTALDATLMKAEARQKEAFDAAQAQNAKAMAAEREYADLETRISAIRQELAQKRVASSAAEFDAMLRVRDGMRQDLLVLQERQVAVGKNVESEQQLAAALQRTSQELARKTGMARESVAAQSGVTGAAGLGGAVGGAIGAAGTMAAFAAVQSLDQAIHKIITSYIEWGHAVEHTATISGSSAEQASVLLYTFQRFGVDVPAADRALIMMARHVEENEDKFRKLGVQTRDVNGEFKNEYEIFSQLQAVFSSGKAGITETNDAMQLLARAGAGGGAAFGELLAILRLTPEQMQAVNKEATALGLVLDEAAAKRAYELYNQMRANDLAMKGLQVTIGQTLAPAIGGMIDWFTRAIATVRYATEGVDHLAVAFANVIRIFPGVGAVLDSLDAVTGGHLAQGTKDLEAFKQEAVDTARQIGAALDSGNGSTPDVSNAAMQAERQAARDALQDQIRDVENKARADEEAMRAALLRYERERQAAIQRIQDEQKADDDASREAQDRRAKEISDLRVAIQLREQSLQQFEAEYQLEKDRRALAHDQSPVGRGTGESLIQYAERVSRQQLKIQDDQHRVTVDQRRLELDQFKATTDEQIRRIDAVATEEKKRADERRELRSADIEGIRHAMQVERDRSNEAVKQVQDAARTQVQALQDQIRAIKDVGTAVGTLAQKTIDAYDRIERHVIASMDRIVRAEADANQRSLDGQKKYLDQRSKVLGSTGDPHDQPLMPPHPAPFARVFDRGGSMLLTKPTALVDLSSGATIGKAALSGPERASFGGEMPAGSGIDRPLIIQLVADGHQLTQTIIPHLGDELDRVGGLGYGRKR